MVWSDGLRRLRALAKKLQKFVLQDPVLLPYPDAFQLSAPHMRIDRAGRDHKEPGRFRRRQYQRQLVKGHGTFCHAEYTSFLG